MPAVRRVLVPAAVRIMPAVRRMLVPVPAAVGVMPALVMAVWPGGRALLGHGVSRLPVRGAGRAGRRLDSSRPVPSIMCI
jgi:hypothetical protein